MCYSALIEADYRRYVREFGATVSLEDFTAQAMADPGKGKRPKWPKAMRDTAAAHPAPEATQLRNAVRFWIAQDIAEAERELVKQRRRVADGELALAEKLTKKAADDVRIGGNKVAQLEARLVDLRRKEPKPRDSRIYPGYYAPVMVWQDGGPVVLPMRYQCRPAGKPEFYDRKYPGTYNARRDNLEGFWKGLFGKTHGVMLASAFYEHVERDGKDQVLEFRPQDGSEMLVACLWSSWIGKDGEELLSFAAITDDPPAEVAAAGHDRCIIPIRRGNLDRWLAPGANLDDLQAVLDDRERPYYEHREAA
ncbi:SOS response-associated peptidase family protein [Luteimonas sp. MJ174]|uniref:SOS response-associated peptidase family protein n=1 Tax=Luteimonas sp. MJ174 TaxID=3129237 RepID=UPI0031BAD375